MRTDARETDVKFEEGRELEKDLEKILQKSLPGKQLKKSMIRRVIDAFGIKAAPAGSRRRSYREECF